MALCSYSVAWLPLAVAAGLDGFDEQVVSLAGAGAQQEKALEARRRLLEHSPTGKLPSLYDPEADVTVYDSVAICEYINELFPDAQLLPTERAARAVCRSVCAEMHAGFMPLRKHMPMNVRLRAPEQGAKALQEPGVKEDIDRICDLFENCRAQYGADGPFLFGRFSLADCMYAPVAMRFITYQPPLTPVAEEYVRTICAMNEIRDWIASAEQEEWVLSQYEFKK